MKIQILTVSYFSSDLLKLNWNMFNSRNCGHFDYTWHIMDNSITDDIHMDEFIYHDGIKHKVDPIRIDKIKLGCGSVHHGLGMTKGIEHLDETADLWLMLDPDFFFTVPIKPIIDFIFQEDLWFYGAEYANTRKKLIKGFPCLYCMFINPKYVKRSDIDFTVGYSSEVEQSEGWYPDAGFKTMYKFSNDPACKFGVFPATDSNSYYVGKQMIAHHSRAKMNKLAKFLHGMEASDIGLKSKLKYVKDLHKSNINGKIQVSDLDFHK